jgi:mono/diheme cytochrome c family protein
MKIRMVASACALIVSSVAASAAPADSSAAASQGQKLFTSYNCYECHGRVGQGGAGPTIAPPRLPDHATFMSFVRHPNPPAMPPYTTKVLADADLSSIWDYLNSLPPPPQQLPPELARLKQASK